MIERPIYNQHHLEKKMLARKENGSKQQTQVVPFNQSILSLKPAFQCDEWDAKTRTCWLDRNIGDTVTFRLSFKNRTSNIPKVIWKKEHHIRGKTRQKSAHTSTSPNMEHCAWRQRTRDLGFVYPGETIMLNMDSFISLPLESMQYVWYLEKDSKSGSLPSNMKRSPSEGC
ncbi:EGF-like domain-containing protein [Caerostris extrusa]|uniref:EGF-like domain-containing protein n=1 Tax=Caerostris extrusa TaxID=172846 RepID=A0AAV4RKP4_CAEEX|nr:EGF-like domain-containing protein [Caerostris extrusa]